nr:esterase FrsA [Streptomyces sp. TLI_235]
MSHIAYGGADFGEVVSTGERIEEGDHGSWHDEWLATADRVAGEAQQALDAGHTISARDGFLRASNYYRSAEFFLHGHPCDPCHDHAYDRSVACFRAAAALFTPCIEPVAIPYESTTLPGYLYRADTTRAPRPTLIMHSGFDGTAEELHFQRRAGGRRTRLHRADLRRTRTAGTAAPRGSALPPGLGERHHPRWTSPKASRRSTTAVSHCWVPAWAACSPRGRQHSNTGWPR